MSQVARRIADPAEHHALGRTGNQRPAAPITEVVVQIAGGSVDIVLLALDAELPAAGELARCLSGDERRRAERFVFERDQRRFIVGRARLRHFLASRLGVGPESVAFAYGPRGKPGLAARFASADLRFNLSHSGGFAVYAFACGREVGVDVESVRELRDADQVAARFFSRRENMAYLSLDPRDRPQGFFNCWTRKEAFIKALGDGLHHPLGHFDVSLAPGMPARILRVGDTPGDACGWSLENLVAGHGLAAAVVVETRGSGPGVTSVAPGLVGSPWVT